MHSFVIRFINQLPFLRLHIQFWVCTPWVRYYRWPITWDKINDAEIQIWKVCIAYAQIVVKAISWESMKWHLFVCKQRINFHTSKSRRFCFVSSNRSVTISTIHMQFLFNFSIFSGFINRILLSERLFHAGVNYYLRILDVHRYRICSSNFNRPSLCTLRPTGYKLQSGKNSMLQFPPTHSDF